MSSAIEAPHPPAPAPPGKTDTAALAGAAPFILDFGQGSRE